jgi:hypothetical protein
MLGEFGDNSCSLLISPAQRSRELWYEFYLWSQQVDIAGGKDDKRVYGNSIEIFQRNGRHSTDKGNVSFGDHIILDGVVLHKRQLRDVERPSRKYCMTVDG